MIAREKQLQLKENANIDAARARSWMFDGECYPKANPDCTAAQVVTPKQGKEAQSE